MDETIFLIVSELTGDVISVTYNHPKLTDENHYLVKLSPNDVDKIIEIRNGSKINDVSMEATILKSTAGIKAIEDHFGFKQNEEVTMLSNGRKVRCNVEISSLDGLCCEKYLRVYPVGSKHSWIFCNPAAFILHGWVDGSE